MCEEGPNERPIPSGNRTEINKLIAQLHEAQRIATQRIQESASYEALDHVSPDGDTVTEILRMWVWHFWTHQRDLVRTRGSLRQDDPHFHVPHFVRQANEEFGRYIGELSCLSDEYLDMRPPEHGRTVRESVEHVLDCLQNHFANGVEQAKPKE